MLCGDKKKSLFLKHRRLLISLQLRGTWTHSELNTCVLRLRFPEDMSSRNVTPKTPSLFPFHQFCVASCHSALLLSQHSEKILCRLWFWVYMRKFLKNEVLWNLLKHLSRPSLPPLLLTSCIYTLWNIWHKDPGVYFSSCALKLKATVQNKTVSSRFQPISSHAVGVGDVNKSVAVFLFI